MTLRAEIGSRFARVTGIGYRAMSSGDQLTGSRSPGRWGPLGVLYLSATPAGVEAAMQAHGGLEGRRIHALRVDAQGIVDLREPDLEPLRKAGACDWRDALIRGERPASWDVAQRVIDLGANGLIDPSRKAPDLWHLVLFRWNAPGAPQIALAD